MTWVIRERKTDYGLPSIFILAQEILLISGHIGQKEIKFIPLKTLSDSQFSFQFLNTIIQNFLKHIYNFAEKDSQVDLFGRFSSTSQSKEKIL